MYELTGTSPTADSRVIVTLVAASVNEEGARVAAVRPAIEVIPLVH